MISFLYFLTHTHTHTYAIQTYIIEKILFQVNIQKIRVIIRISLSCLFDEFNKNSHKSFISFDFCKWTHIYAS